MFNLRPTLVWIFVVVDSRLNFDCRGPWHLFEEQQLSIRYTYAMVFVSRSWYMVAYISPLLPSTLARYSKLDAER